MDRLVLTMFLAVSMAAVVARADDSPPPASPAPLSKHQMMKECMAKQKASDGGMPKEDMKRACKDVTSTEHENEEADRKEESSEKHADSP